MSTTKLQQHIDGCGRLAAIISELHVNITHMDVLALCDEANVALTNDAKLPGEAFRKVQDLNAVEGFE